MANLYDMYYSLAMNRKLFAEGDEEANRWADDVEKCFARDSMLCRHYNQEIASGKWNHMMDQVHIGYTQWHAPRHNVMPKVYRIQENDQQDKPLTTGFVFMEKAEWCLSRLSTWVNAEMHQMLPGKSSRDWDVPCRVSPCSLIRHRWKMPG